MSPLVNGAWIPAESAAQREFEDTFDRQLPATDSVAPKVRRHPATIEQDKLRQLFERVLEQTDIGNAALFAEVVLDEERSEFHLRHVYPWDKWLGWNGKIYAPDQSGVAIEAAQTLVSRELIRRAVEAYTAAVLPEDDRRKILRHALASSGRRKIVDMLELARCNPKLQISPDQLDADPWLLNVQNGVLDLRTGKLRPHDPAYYMTKICPVDFDPAVSDPILDKYLLDVTGGDQEFADLLQRACGYTLTGCTTEEVFFLLLGPGATGKTTLLEALMTAMGSYAAKSSMDTFLVRRQVGGPRPDLARLPGVRLTAACEASSLHQLDAVLVKEFVGGDRIATRDVYGRTFEFTPVAKLFLASNEAPRMSDLDTGLWRRLRRLPFERVITNPDPAVKAHLLSEAGSRAVLAWAAEGCLAWQQKGLGSCALVDSKTAELRADMNPLAEFFDTYTTTGPDLMVPVAQLRAEYEAWATRNGTRPISNKAWGERLRSMGCERWQGPRPDRAWFWQGIGLISDRTER